MAVRVSAVDSLAEGAAYSFRLRDLGHAVEVRGRVRWIGSNQRRSLGSGPVDRYQMVGIAFEEILTDTLEGLWRNLQIDRPLPERDRPIGEEDGAREARQLPPAPHGTADLDQSGSPTLVVPLDGAEISGDSITVVCRVREYDQVSSVSINGVTATVEGELAAAEIELRPGDNRLRILVWRDDGSYRTYLLGSVIRKES